MMNLTKAQIDKLLEDYVPESKTESLLNRHHDLVEITFYWNKYTRRWDNEESAKKVFKNDETSVTWGKLLLIVGGLLAGGSVLTLIVQQIFKSFN